jgi:hypothetical protein
MFGLFYGLGVGYTQGMNDGRPYKEPGPHMVLRDKIGNVLTYNECDQLREW